MLSFTWVDAAGKVHVSARDSPEGRALSGGVGLIGIITGVRVCVFACVGAVPSHSRACV